MIAQFQFLISCFRSTISLLPFLYLLIPLTNSRRTKPLIPLVIYTKSILIVVPIDLALNYLTQNLKTKIYNIRNRIVSITHNYNNVNESSIETKKQHLTFERLSFDDLFESVLFSSSSHSWSRSCSFMKIFTLFYLLKNEQSLFDGSFFLCICSFAYSTWFNEQSISSLSSFSYPDSIGTIRSKTIFVPGGEVIL